MNRIALSLFALAGYPAVVSAQSPVMIAGWDFSQFLADGITSIDGASYATSLAANYSDLDPNGLGAESAAFGRLHYDGQFGSASGDPASEVLPIQGNLANNSDPGAFGFPFNASGSYTILASEGQAFTSPLSLTVTSGFGGGSGDLVFAATPGSPYSDWQLAFSARTTQAGTVSAGILFSTDGTNYSPAGTASITATDTLFQFSVPGSSASAGYWKLDFAGLAGLVNPVIDNVSIKAKASAAAPSPVVSIAAAGAVLTVSCASETGFAYTLERSGNLAEPWQPLETKPGTGAALNFNTAAPAAGAAVFFRVSTSVTAP